MNPAALKLLLHNLFDDVFVVNIQLIVDGVGNRIVWIGLAVDVSPVLVLLILWGFEASIFHYLLL